MIAFTVDPIEDVSPLLAKKNDSTIRLNPKIEVRHFIKGETWHCAEFHCLTVSDMERLCLLIV